MEVKITFEPPLIEGTLIKRYKRFLSDVKLAKGRTITVLCPNTGSMKSCSEPGRPVRLSYHPAPHRKYPHTWEMIQMDAGWVGVNTNIPNTLGALAVQYGAIPELLSYPKVTREVRYGENSRIDILAEGAPGRCYVEIKNVSLCEGDAVTFPDAVTDRGTKHLNELMKVVQTGDRAIMLFVIQRPDGKVFRPADHIDPLYGETLRMAADRGVELLAYRARVTPTAIYWGEPVPIELTKSASLSGE